LQVEVYFTHIVATVATPPTAAVNFELLCDAAAGATATYFTVQPTYTIQYARATPDSAPGSDAVTRVLTQSRAPADAALATDAVTRWKVAGTRARATYAVIASPSKVP